MYSQNEVLAFQSIMSGAKEFYGTTVVGDIVNGKAESSSSCVHEPPVPSIYENHLAGKVSIGISPLKADNTVGFGAIDIDDYKGDLLGVVRAIWDFDMPICPCFSKSRKLHLYFFFDQGSSAADAVEVMRWYARAFACNKKVEVFPKQVERSIANKAYSWINLPYFDCDSDNHRKMVARDGSTLDLETFLDRASKCKLSIESHKVKIKSYPCYDAPPCILTGAILRDVGTGGRNNWLFSVAVYLKLKDESVDLEVKLQEINDSLDNPLTEQELRSTILASLSRKSYFYMCSTLDRCDKSLCQGMEFGVGNTKTTGIEYGDLTQTLTDPPSYEWEVNGQKMIFYTEEELLRQNKFRALCLRNLHIVPRPVDERVWSKILTKACENINVVTVENKGNDFTTGSRFYDLACKYFGEQRRALNMTQVAMGRVFADEEKHEYVFTAWNLITFMTEVNGFKGLSQMEMRTKMLEMGAYKDNQYWRLPMDNIQLPEKQEIMVDMNTHEGESNDF